MATVSAFRAPGLQGFTAQARVPVELQPSGVAELDALLGGGFPRGSLVEVCGHASSGRTSLCLALLAQATGQQQACALVDVSDSLDPPSLAAAGVDLARLLWVRCGSGEESDSSEPPSSVIPVSQQTKEQMTHADLLLPIEALETRRAGFVWQHPRNQMRGLETSIPSLMRDDKTRIGGTDFEEGNAAASPLQRTTPLDPVARCTGEQVEADRQRPRRGDNIRRKFPRSQNLSTIGPMTSRGPSPHAKPWKRLEQALKTTDLLLHSGGWGVVVLDLGSISWVDARRIPLSTWFRFQRIVEKTLTILLLLGEETCARGCASLALRCRRRRDRWGHAASSKMKSVATLQGFEIKGELVRSRTLEPVGSAHWETHSLWSGST